MTDLRRDLEARRTDCSVLSENLFDAAAPFYDAWYEMPLGRLVDELEMDLIYGLAAPVAGERALDVGTGTGHFAFDLARRGLKVTGVDISGAMLNVARAKGESVALVTADAGDLPFEDSSFDLVLSVTNLEFVSQPEKALSEMWRVTCPGGRMVVAVLNAWSPWARARQREALEQDTPFRYAHFFAPREFVGKLRHYGPTRWNSSVFITPGGRGQRLAWALERTGRLVLRPFGALLVGRVSKMG